MIVSRELVALVDERMDAVQASVDELRLMAANIRMANADDEKYVTLDNLRRMQDVIAKLHMRLGRLDAARELADDAGSCLTARNMVSGEPYPCQ